MSRTPKLADDVDMEDISWISPKRRPRPQSLSATSVEVSRQSGLATETGTFGFASRFSEKVKGHGASSPVGHTFYSRNALFKMQHEYGHMCTQGIGSRPDPANDQVSKTVGPGSYEIIASCAGPKSPLDGREFCHTTIKMKLPSKLIPADNCSPGPHAKYDVRKPLDHGLPCYKWASHSGPARPMHGQEDNPGPGHYPVHEHKSVSSSTSCPNLRKPGDSVAHSLEAAGGSKRCVKSTFGVSERFPGSKMSCSPQGNMYYAHSKICNSEDYMAESRSCSMGGGDKIDLTNPYKAPRMTTSPVTYTPQPGYGVAMKSSPGLDSFAMRCVSPVHAACQKTPKSTKNRTVSFGLSASAQSPKKSTGALSAKVAFARGSSAEASGAEGAA